MNAKLLVISLGIGIVGCGTIFHSKAVDERISTLAVSTQDSSLVAIDRTDYAKGWLGTYIGEGSVFSDKLKRVENFRPIELLIKYGQRTSDGRQTLFIRGISSISTGQGEHFYLLNIEVDDMSSISGFVMRGDRFATKYEYALTKNKKMITGKVIEYLGESQYGPFRSTDKWEFEVSGIEDYSME